MWMGGHVGGCVVDHENSGMVDDVFLVSLPMIKDVGDSMFPKRLS